METLRTKMIAAFFIFLLSFTATLAGAADRPANLPSFGKGAWELFVFTNYFCGPCQSVENELEPELARLADRGDVRIIFVDLPSHKTSVLYAKYFLYAVAAKQDFGKILKARNRLFSLAAKKTDREEDLAAAFKAENIAYEIVDPKPVFEEWTALMKRYNIRQSPTCVLRFSGTYTQQYTDAQQIRTKLFPELKKRFPDEPQKK